MQTKESRQQTTQWHVHALAMVLLLLLASGLRLYKLGQESLWFDELGQAVAGQQSLQGAIAGAAQHWRAAPPDYIVTHFTLHLGRSETILRLPAAVFGVLSIVMIFCLGKCLFDDPTSYLAAFLLAIMPLHIYYSRELRFYSLATLLTLTSLYTFKRAVDRNSLSAWALYGLVQGLALYTHYYALIVMFLQGIWLLWLMCGKLIQPATLVRFVATGGVLGALFLPWLYYDLLVGEGQWTSALWVYFAWIPWLALLLIIGAVMTAIRKSAKWSDRTVSHAALLLYQAVGGIISVLILDYIGEYFFSYRQGLIFAPAALILLSALYLNMFQRMYSGFFHQAKGAKAKWIGAVGLMVVGSIVALPSIDHVHKEEAEDWRAVGDILNEQLCTDDILFTLDPNIESLVSFYSPQLSDQIEYLREFQTLPLIARSHSRIWILSTPYDRSFDTQQLSQWIRNSEPIEIDVEGGLSLYIFSFNADVEPIPL